MDWINKALEFRKTTAKVKQEMKAGTFEPWLQLVEIIGDSVNAYSAAEREQGQTDPSFAFTFGAAHKCQVTDRMAAKTSSVMLQHEIGVITAIINKDNEKPVNKEYAVIVTTENNGS